MILVVGAVVFAAAALAAVWIAVEEWQLYFRDRAARQRCGAIGIGASLGRCVLAAGHQHDDPWHRDRAGNTWAEMIEAVLVDDDA